MKKIDENVTQALMKIAIEDVVSLYSAHVDADSFDYRGAVFPAQKQKLVNCMKPDGDWEAYAITCNASFDTTFSLMRTDLNHDSGQYTLRGFVRTAIDLGELKFAPFGVLFVKKLKANDLIINTYAFEEKIVREFDLCLINLPNT